MQRTVLIIIFFALSFVQVQAQEVEDVQSNSPIDEKYLEDQIYVAFTYNVLANKPVGIYQKGLSGGIGLGFIKDIPFNEERNFGVGIGLGYSRNIYIHNLKIIKSNNLVSFEQAEDYFSNKFTKQSIDIPFEIRWRTSDPVSVKFWRIYAGMTFSYVFNLQSNFRDQNGTVKTRHFKEVEKLQYGLNLAAGKGTWNIYVYYALSEMFNNATYNQEPLELYDINFGLKLYIM